MKPVITVVSLGPGDPKLLTMQSVDAIRKSRCLILRTARHRTAEWLQEEGIAYSDFDALYDEFDDFDSLHAEMARLLWETACEKAVTFAVIDAQTDGAVRALRSTRPEDGKITILPGVTMADSCLALLPDEFEQSGSVRILPAMDAVNAAADPSVPLLVTEVFDRVLASDLKLRLSDLYGDEATVVFFPGSAKINRKPMVIPMMELDRQRTYDHTVCLYIPAIDLKQRQRYCFDDLLRVMRKLRQECPWDGEQTHESLRKYLLEEAYEAVGAIDEDDMDHLADELGDVLLQIVFHADIAQEFGEFSISDVTSNIVSKLLYRHAHIFGDVHCDTADEVAQSWEKLKKAEKGLTTQASVLADVSQGLPALMRAAKVGKKSGVMDFPDVASVFAKLDEEKAEVIEALDGGDAADVFEEIGDLLFTAANLARKAGVDPEEALTRATDKYISRFTAVEEMAEKNGTPLDTLSGAEREILWQKCKKNTK